MTAPQQDWTAQVVTYLCECKAAGITFENAWAGAILTYRPRTRDCGPERPQLIPDADEAEPLVAFFKRACSDAWHGRRPGLKHFHASLLTDFDGSGPAFRTRRLAA